MYDIADSFNHSSTAQYFISYKRPKLVIGTYMFQVKLIGQFITSMHTSAKGHTCYIFCRVSIPRGVDVTCVPCDALFIEAWETCKYSGTNAVHNHVAARVAKFLQEKPLREHKQPDRLGFN